MMEAYIQRVINIYSDDTMDDLHDKLDQARQRIAKADEDYICLLYTSPSPRDGLLSRMPSSA